MDGGEHHQAIEIGHGQFLSVFLKKCKFDDFSFEDRRFHQEREQELKQFVDESGTMFDCFLKNPSVMRMIVSTE